MATEISIPESVCLKKGEMEDNALSIEILGENATLLPGNKVKQLESGLNQPIETSSQVAETVNTPQLETSEPTNESGTFFQALSIPMALADEHSNTPESCLATAGEDQEVRKTTEIEAYTEGKPNDEQVVAVASTDISSNVHQPNKADHDLVKASSVQTEGSVGHAFGKEIEEVADDQRLDEVVGATNDVGVSTEMKNEEETIKNEEKNDEIAIEKEAGEESSPEKAESELSDSMVPSKTEEVNKLEKDQGDSEGVASSQDETCEDKKEAPTGEQAITVADFKEELAEDKAIDAQEASKQFEDEVGDGGDQKPEECVNDIVQEEEFEKIKPSLDLEQKVDQNGLLHAITTDACTSKQERSQVDSGEHEKKNDETTQSDDVQKEKSDSPPIKEVSEENTSESVEYEKEEEVNMSEKHQDEVDLASTQDVTFEGGLQEINQHSEANEGEVVEDKGSIEEDTEEIRYSVKTPEKAEQQKLENTASTGVSILTQTEPKEEKNDGLAIENNDGLNKSEIVSKDEDQEKEQVLSVLEKSQTGSQVETTKLEEGPEEVTVTESDDIHKENSANLSLKEVCEETDSEKVEYERVEHSDSSIIKMNEKEVEVLNKDEVQEKEQDQGENDITCSQDATSIEELQGKSCEEKGQEPEFVKSRESLVVDSEEMRSNVETSVETENQGLHDGITTDVCVSTPTELEEGSSKNEEKAIEMDSCQEITPENAESEVGLKLSDSMVPSEKEDVSMLEKDQGDTEGVTSSQYETVVANVIEQDLNERSREFIMEETEDKPIAAQKESEQCEIAENVKNEENLEESAKNEYQEKEQEVNMLEKNQGGDVPFEGGVQEKNHHCEANKGEVVRSKESIEEDTEEIRSSAKTPETAEQQTEQKEETTKKEHKNNVEATESDDGQAKKSEIPIIEEIQEETVSEKAESKDDLKIAESSSIVLNDNEIASKDEDQEKEQELYVSERSQSSVDDVTSLQNASNEDIKETMIGQHVTTVARFEEEKSLSAVPNEFIKEEEEEKSIDAQEVTEQHDDGANDNVEQKPKESVNEVEQEEYTEEIKSNVETNEENDVCISKEIESQEDATNNEERAIESDGDQKEKSDNPFVKEVCEDNDLNKTEYAEEITLSDSSNVKTNEDSVTTFKDEDQEEGQEVNLSTEGHGNEGEFVKTRESVDEETAETKPNDETKENMEQQELVCVISTDVSTSKQIEPKEETTSGKEKNDEDAIENDDGQTKKPENPLVKEVCDTISSEKAESGEAVEHYDSFTSLNENEVVSKEEKLEKEEELNISEVQGGGDDVISSHNASHEEMKETTIGQPAPTVAHFEEEQGMSAMPKEIIMEETENKLMDAQEDINQFEKAKDKEQQPEESVNEPVNSCSVTDKGDVNEDEIAAGNKNIETNLDAENQADRTEDRSEMKDEAISNEKISMELGQPREQNVEEIQACLVNPITENSKDKIKKEEEDLSHESVEDISDNITKEETCTLEHEPVEEQHSEVDEVSTKKNINLNETTVEPQEDITPSSSLGTLTEDTSNLEKEKVSENLPIEDLKSVSDIQIPELVTNIEDSKQKEECLISETATHVDEEKEVVTKEISSDEKTEEATETKQETIKDEETSLEKAESEEGLKLSDSSNITINEKGITSFEDDKREMDREVNMSIEGQGKDNITSSQNEVYKEEENLQEKSNQKDGNDSEFVKSREGVDEDTEEIKSNVESQETMDENEKISTEESLEKEHEHEMSEFQGGEENVPSSQNASNEDIKETTIGQYATTVAYFEEGHSVGAMTKEILGEEVEEKSIDAQEACEQHENKEKDKREQKPEEPGNSCSETIEGNIKEDEADAANKEIEDDLIVKNQAEKKDEGVLMEKISTDLEQPKEQSVVKIQGCLTETKMENTEDDITEKDEDLSHDNVEVTNDNSTKEEKCFPEGTREIEISTLEHDSDKEQSGSLDAASKVNFTDLNESTIEAQEDITHSSSMGTSVQDNSNSKKAKAESEDLPTADLESVSEVQIPEVLPPKSADPKQEEECLISKTTTCVDEEKETVTKEISSDENLEPSGSTPQPENTYSNTEENVTQLEQTGEINSVYEKRDIEEDVTQEHQLKSNEYCSEMVKDVILTEEVAFEIEKKNETNDFKEQIVEEDSQKISAQNQKDLAPEISYQDPVTVGNPEVTEVKVNTQNGEEDLQAAEAISYESKVKYDGVDEAPKEEKVPTIEDAATIKPQVELSNIKFSACPSETEKLATHTLESVCDVQTSEVVADSENSKVKEECVVIATPENVDEEQETKIDESLCAADTEQEIVKQAPTKSDEVKSGDLNIEEKVLAKEDCELHGELKPPSESMIDGDQTNETKSQPDEPNITSENIVSDQTLESKLEHISEKHLEDEKRDMEEDVTLAPENQIKSIENQNETMKNVILTDEVAVETDERGQNEVNGQISEEDNCPTELSNTSTPNQKELANEIEYSKLIPSGNTEVKTESQIELENTQAAEDLSCLPKAFLTENKKEAPNLEFEKKEMDEELISEVQTPESTLKMEIKEEHPETTNETCETVISEESSEKLLDEPEVVDAKENIKLIGGEEKDAEVSSHNEVTEMKVHEHVPQTEENKLVSVVPPEELTSQMAEDQTDEQVPETDKTHVEHSSISNRNLNQVLMEKEFTETFSEDQSCIKERYIEEEGQSNIGVESKEAKGDIEVVEDVIVNEVVLDVEKAMESKRIKDNIDEEASQNDEVCQIERSSSSPNNILETKGSVVDTADAKLMAENFGVKDETFIVMKEIDKQMKHNVENMMTEEKIINADANKEKETLEEPQRDSPVKTITDSILSSTEQDVKVISEESRGHVDAHMQKENSTEVHEITSEVAEIVTKGREASANLTESLPEASHKLLLEKQDPEITTTTETIEEQINEKDKSAGTKEVVCLSDKKNAEIQVSILSSEIDEGKHNVPGDLQGEVMECASQERSENNTLLSENDKKIEDDVVLQSVEKDIMQGEDKRFEEAPVIDVEKNKKDLDSEAKISIEHVKKSGVELKSDIDATAEKAEKEVLKEDLHLESTNDGRETTDEVSGMKQNQLELDSSVTPGTAAAKELEISQKKVTDDLVIASHTQPEIQKYELSASTADEQSPKQLHQNESTESKLVTGEIDASHEQGEPIAKSLIAGVEDLKSTKTTVDEPQCNSEVFKDEKITSEEKEKSETAEPSKILSDDILTEPTKGNSKVAENLIVERESALTKDQKVDKDEIGDNEVKSDEENEEEEEEDNEDHEKMGSCSDAPVIVEASKDMDAKIHKKSHNILSGVGSKVKHSIAKVKKAITGKSSNSKPPSPKEKDQVFA